MRITTTSKFAIAAALSLAIGVVPGSAAAQSKYSTYTPPAVSTPSQAVVVNTAQLPLMALATTSSFFLVDDEDEKPSAHAGLADPDEEAKRVAEEEAKKQTELTEEEVKQLAERAADLAKALDEARKRAEEAAEEEAKKQAHLEQEERDRKIAEDKKRRGAEQFWGCGIVVMCDPIDRDDPGGFPRIVIDIPGPGPGPGPNPGKQATETAELVRPCFAAGVIVSPADDQENSDEEQVTDSSEVLCSGAAASSPLTTVASDS